MEATVSPKVEPTSRYDTASNTFSLQTVIAESARLELIVKLASPLAKKGRGVDLSEASLQDDIQVTLLGILEEMGERMHSLTSQYADLRFELEGRGRKTFNTLPKERASDMTILLREICTQDSSQPAPIRADFHYVANPDDDATDKRERAIALIEQAFSAALSAFCPENGE